MRKLVVGILAHVDAGKTTLSEALLYQSGALRRLGRVDHQDAFLDTDAMERERGITIFSKQAVFSLADTEVTLLDTPGHVDFSAEAERTLQVLDCAILVISGTDGVQAHTRTLWRLLERYHVPTFLFINKMDLAGADRSAVLAGLKQRLGSGCVDFSGERDESFREEAAVCDESVLERYLETGVLTDGDLRRMVGKRKLFPCWFGSALKLEGVAEFLEGVEQYAPRKCCPPQFGARVYKVARDAQGVRLTYLKITGGSLRVKTPLTGGEGEMRWEEKADQIRIYSGAKYRAVEEAEAGTVCAVTGLSRTRPGEGLGFEAPGAGAGAHLPAGAAGGVRSPRGSPAAAGAGGGGPPAPHPVGRAPAGDPYPAHGGGAAGDPPPGHRPAVRHGGLLRRGEHRLPGDHRRAGGGRGPL